VKAARVEDGVLHIRDVPVPEPGDGDALIRITAAGVCHSDLHLARGEWMGLPPLMNLGHEAIGIVEALGPGADRFAAIGDRVILGLGGSGGGYWCGACKFCLQGQPRHCRESKGIIGTFAEYFCVWARSLVKIPDSLGDHEAPLACGGLTAYGAVKKVLDHRVLPGRPVAVVGAAGGLGHYAVQIAKTFGYQVVAVDVGQERLDFAKSLGADLTLDATDAAAAVELVQREFGGVDASLVFAAKLAGFRLGFDLLGPRGLFVAVGLPATSEGNLEFNPFQLFMKDATIMYSAVGTVQDMRELVDLASAGRVASHVSRAGTLSELGTIFDELAAGQYLGRAVITDLAG
jgi:alcohol dehydrogenase, propanol-preferring